MHNIALDDIRYLSLEAEEVFSEIIIVELRQLLGPSPETRWQRKDLEIPDEAPQVMEGVEGLLNAASRLFDVGELRYVFEHVFAILETFGRFVDKAASL